MKWETPLDTLSIAEQRAWLENHCDPGDTAIFESPGFADPSAELYGIVLCDTHPFGGWTSADWVQSLDGFLGYAVEAIFWRPYHGMDFVDDDVVAEVVHAHRAFCDSATLVATGGPGAFRTFCAQLAPTHSYRRLRWCGTLTELMTDPTREAADVRAAFRAECRDSVPAPLRESFGLFIMDSGSEVWP